MTADRSEAKVTGDPLENTYEIKFAHEVFLAKKEGPRINFFRPGERESFGYIRVGGPRSGAVWMGEECIGENEQDQEGEWVVVPVAEDRKNPDAAVRMHPIPFLLTSAIGAIHPVS